MKANVHPSWFSEAKVTCACGNTFVTGSTLPEIRVDICSSCHPLYTGQAKLVDTLGQVERYQKKMVASEAKIAERKKILEVRSSKVEQKKSAKPTLKELLMQARKQAAS